jgi:DNA-directed RNA polymerase specialized sigma24 family protein
MADAEDAVQSAFASFCQHARAGDFEIADRSELWNLLGLITKRKARAQARREAAAKRGGGRTLEEGALRGPEGRPLPLDQAAEGMTHEDFDLHVTELLERLEPALREFAVLRAMGFQNREIAERLDCTERKVERKLQLIRLAWEAEWPG